MSTPCYRMKGLSHCLDEVLWPSLFTKTDFFPFTLCRQSVYFNEPYGFKTAVLCYCAFVLTNGMLQTVTLFIFSCHFQINLMSKSFFYIILSPIKCRFSWHDQDTEHTTIEFRTLNFEDLIRNQYHTSAFEVGTRLGLTDFVTPRNYRSIDLVFLKYVSSFYQNKMTGLFYLTMPAFMDPGPVRRTYKHCSDPKYQ